MFILRKLYSAVVDLFETLVIAGGIFVVVYAFLFRPFQVNGQSMFPTLHDGEYILTNLITLRVNNLNRGDVIVFKSPTNDEKDFIKRIIGLPGDIVMVKGGKTFVNNKQLQENEYLPSDFVTNPGSFLKENSPIKVPQDHYFVLGDNRDFSSDSREWGFVAKNKIIGKSMIAYWPPSNAKFVEHEKYDQVK